MLTIFIVGMTESESYELDDFGYGLWIILAGPLLALMAALGSGLATKAASVGGILASPCDAAEDTPLHQQEEALSEGRGYSCGASGRAGRVAPP